MMRVPRGSSWIMPWAEWRDRIVRLRIEETYIGLDSSLAPTAHRDEDSCASQPFLGTRPTDRQVQSTQPNQAVIAVQAFHAIEG
jgi:hypothetical protein